jgi:hypothetical protein
MKRIAMAVATVLGLAVCGSAFAEESPEQRQRNQQERIDQGVRSGQLTDREANRLEAQHQKINRDIKAAKADGEMTPGERAKIEREQNRLSKRIYKQKHDAQVR